MPFQGNQEMGKEHRSPYESSLEEGKIAVRRREFQERLTRIFPPELLARVESAAQCHKYVSFRGLHVDADFPAALRVVADMGVSTRVVPWFPSAAIAEPAARETLTRLELPGVNRIYLQNLSSILVALLLDVEPGQTVLDLAAAPGGKCALLAQQMQNQGTLSAVEPIRSRMFRLRRVLDDAGVTIVRTYPVDGRVVGGKTPDRFDRVLLDAPCSGESRVHRDRLETFHYWSRRKIAEQARKQTGLLRSALRALKPGGKMIYCTCAFAPEENERVIDTVLADFGDQVDIDPISWPDWQGDDDQLRPLILSGLTEWDGRALDPRLARAARIVPDAIWDGFFVAQLRKSEDTRMDRVGGTRRNR